MEVRRGTYTAPSLKAVLLRPNVLCVLSASNEGVEEEEQLEW